MAISWGFINWVPALSSLWSCVVDLSIMRPQSMKTRSIVCLKGCHCVVRLFAIIIVDVFLCYCFTRCITCHTDSYKFTLFCLNLQVDRVCAVKYSFQGDHNILFQMPEILFFDSSSVDGVSTGGVFTPPE